MDKIEQVIFEQTIFPPNEKKADQLKNICYLPPASENCRFKIFESWIVANELYVKCPACGFVYKLSIEVNVEEFQRILESYSITYFKKIVRDCPNVIMHEGIYECYD